ncbi:MAG TPA: PRC-barrel domain-containing protein [Gemmatimonadaceae bacterium]|nr:PRC-barrel domain-containing protein [Gemmatimonadaceae bacterium]
MLNDLNHSGAWPPGDRASYIVPARELSRFRLGRDRVDIRDWPVFASDGRLVGAVKRLMVEHASTKIRYITVSLIRDAVHDLRPTELGCVLVPIGVVRRLDDRQAVVIDGLASGQLARAPRLRARAVTRADEDETLAVYGLPNSREVSAADFYKSPHFDEGRLSIKD